jgi:hypothetical protein
VRAFGGRDVVMAAAVSQLRCGLGMIWSLHSTCCTVGARNIGSLRPSLYAGSRLCRNHTFQVQPIEPEAARA